LPGRVLPEHPVDMRLWLAAAVDSGEMFWLAVYSRTHFVLPGTAAERRGDNPRGVEDIDLKAKAITWP